MYDGKYFYTLFLAMAMYSTPTPCTLSSKPRFVKNWYIVVTGYIWRYAKTQNAALFFRGIRTWSADGPEERHLQILNSWGPLLLGPVWPLKTIFLEGDPRYLDVSSTLVRRICADRRRRRTHRRDDNGGDKGGGGSNADDELTRLVPECVVEKVSEAYG